MVGEKIIGARNAWRSFQAVICRSASSSTWASVARRVRGFLFRCFAAVIALRVGRRAAASSSNYMLLLMGECTGL
jgi:hypothetical protein